MGRRKRRPYPIQMRNKASRKREPYRAVWRFVVQCFSSRFRPITIAERGLKHRATLKGQASRRDAGEFDFRDRGLKPTATFIPSLRDDGQAHDPKMETANRGYRHRANKSTHMKMFFIDEQRVGEELKK